MASPPPGAYFSHAGVDLFYIVEGPAAGPPVLLLHGWTCDNLDWSFQIPFLTGVGFRTVAIDHRGHGRSSVVPGDAYGPEVLADDAAALLAHLGIDQAIVFGHSLGTVVASALAVRHPAAVRALVLVDPVYYLYGEQLAPYVSLFAGANAPAMAAGFFEQTFYTPRSPAWLKAWHRRRTWGNPPAVVAAVFAQLYGQDASLGRRENAVAVFKGRKCPRLVACADEMKVEVEREIGVDEKTDRVELIPEGHWLHQQDADTFNAAVKSWFEARGYLPAALN